jgi:hypothetical protein
MKKRTFKILALSSLMAVSTALTAGNPQRSGSAGASELLINPWARSGGWGSANVAGVSGVEASFLNIAGTANTQKTDVAFTSTQWLVGSGININAAGFNQKVGTSGVLGANFVSFDYGEWDRTTEDNPEGGIGTISPSTVTIGLSYAQKFTESILGGINIKLYSSASDNLSVSALSFDAGVQYITGREKQMKFGITLKNVGPSVSYSGDGKTINLPAPQGGFTQAFEERSATFELPTTLSIGGSYDFNFDSQVLTFAGTFQSNSFEKDQYSLGAQYMIKQIIGVRAGYTLFDNRVFEENTTVFTGLTAGATVALPLGDNGTKVALDYSFRATNQFDGVHSVGLQFTL